MQSRVPPFGKGWKCSCFCKKCLGEECTHWALHLAGALLYSELTWLLAQPRGGRWTAWCRKLCVFVLLDVGRGWNLHLQCRTVKFLLRGVLSCPEQNAIGVVRCAHSVDVNAELYDECHCARCLDSRFVTGTVPA